MRRALALALLCGCALLRPPPAPQVTVSRMEVDFTSDTQGVLRFTVAAPSPTAALRQAASVNFELWLGNRPFASGTQDLHLRILDAQAPEVTVSAPLAFRRRTFAEEPRTVEVGLRGTLLLLDEKTERVVPFAARGPLRLRRSPAIDAEED